MNGKEIWQRMPFQSGQISPENFFLYGNLRMAEPSFFFFTQMSLPTNLPSSFNARGSYHVQTTGQESRKTTFLRLRRKFWKISSPNYSACPRDGIKTSAPHLKTKIDAMRYDLHDTVKRSTENGLVVQPDDHIPDLHHGQFLISFQAGEIVGFKKWDYSSTWCRGTQGKFPKTITYMDGFYKYEMSRSRVLPNFKWPMLYYF